MAFSSSSFPGFAVHRYTTVISLLLMLACPLPAQAVPFDLIVPTSVNINTMTMIEMPTNNLMLVFRRTMP